MPDDQVTFGESAARKIRQATLRVLGEPQSTFGDSGPPTLQGGGIAVVNESGANIPTHACMRIAGMTPNGAGLAVMQPNAYGAQWMHLIGTNRAIGIAGTGVATATWPALARYNPASGNPVVGDNYGPVASDWRLHRHVGGYVCVGIVPQADSSRGTNTQDDRTDLIWVMPAPLLHLRGQTTGQLLVDGSGTINVRRPSGVGAWQNHTNPLNNAQYTVTAYNDYATLQTGKNVELRWQPFATTSMGSGSTGCDNRITAGGFWVIHAGRCG